MGSLQLSSKRSFMYRIFLKLFSMNFSLSKRMLGESLIKRNLVFITRRYLYLKVSGKWFTSGRGLFAYDF